PTAARIGRAVNALRWPPDDASLHTAIGGRKSADRPTIPASRRAPDRACRVENANALASGRSFAAHHTPPPGNRRPPYDSYVQTSAGSGCRVDNALRCPPNGASLHTVIGGRKNADRPTIPTSRRAPDRL